MNLWLPVYPVLFKLDNQEGHIAHGPLLNVMWNLDGRGVWGRMDTCICMAESLWCASEPITALLISYTPMQNKKFKNKQTKTKPCPSGTSSSFLCPSHDLPGSLSSSPHAWLLGRQDSVTSRLCSDGGIMSRLTDYSGGEVAGKLRENCCFPGGGTEAQRGYRPYPGSHSSNPHASPS